MKKIILIFFFTIFPILSFGQINETFEGATFPPTTPGNWLVTDNGVGTGVSWTDTNNASLVYAGAKAAYMNRESIGNGNTSRDWLISPQITVPANGQLRFFTRQTLIGNNGTVYELRVSTSPTQNLLTSYNVVQSWTETTLNTTYNVYEEKAVSLSAFAGQQIYFAFVKVYAQTTPDSGSTGGDRWLIDNVNLVQQCLDPSILGVTAITPTSASLNWVNNGTATAWEVEVIPAAATPTGVGITAPTNPFVITGLTPGTAYKYYVRANCGSGNFSQWVGPFNFITTPAGSICSVPITIPILPYSNSANTNTFGDEVDVIQGASCGAVPTTTNYLQGAEVFYSYTATFTGNLTVSMTATVASSSLFVYNGCGTFPGTCIAGVANTAITPRLIPLLPVIAGNTYIFVISSSTTPAAGVPYTLIIQQANCTPPASLSATNIGTISADLSWSNPSASTSWEVAVQTAGSPIPSGSGVTTTINTNYPATGLTAATAYQYWVRADCGGGLFSAWAGPFLFNTGICEAAQKCTYIFRTNDSFGDGWNGNTMSVRQNGVTVATIVGPTDPDNLNFIDFPVALCETLPFELFWNSGGTFATEVGISVINNFGQTLYTKAPGTGVQNTLLYSTSFDCDTPACLPPTALTATVITTTGATLGWNGAGATAWDVYLVPTGTPAPTVSTTPSYPNITTNPLVVTGLTALTTYQFYVRVVCSASSNSIWAGPFSFTTLPTCPAPTALNVTGAGLSTANLGWTEAGTATQWEVFIQAPGAGVPTGTGILTSLNPYPATGLTSATNYEFYVRAVCSTTDKSTWSGPTAFKTAICNAVDQCNYTFTMRDSFGDSWNGNTMNVVQNGIIVATLVGPTNANGTTPITQVVPMCTNLPIELIWNAGGTFPTEVGVSITNQLGVIIYNKPFGTGTQNSTLFSDIVECTPLPCARPITLGANTITQNSANLTWVQPGSPGTAASWQIIVQPVILGYPSGAGTIVGASPYTVTGLSAAQSYEFYVRTNCGATDGFSNWSGPFVFNTPVANDNCANAILVPVNDDALCGSTVNGSVVGATASLPATNPVCAGSADDDVWFRFVATGPKHYISFSNVAGSNTDLNHAVYSGTSCGALTQLSCQPGTGVTQGSVIGGLVAGNTYYIRVYTATATPNQNTTFTICIGTISTCESADAFCSDPADPFIFPNTVGVPSEGAQSCLGTNPNPTYYFMSVLQSGNIQFQISQNTAFNSSGNPTGTGLDVDFIAWGPFTSNTAACGNLNTTTQVACSYSIAAVENFTIPNAIQGQVYVIVITNFNNGTGFIKFNQTNQGTPGAGATDCSIVCEVDLGPDQNLCGVTSVILNSQLVNAGATYRWFRNGVLIPGATSQTYTATQSGSYRCVGTCGPNDVEDTVVINLGPSVIAPNLADLEVCDDSSNDGIATFNLATLTPLATATLDPNFTYNVSYYYNDVDALAGNANTINPAVPYTGASQVIYIRIDAVGSPACNTILVQNLVVKPTPVATIASSDADNTICSNETATITVTPVNFVATAATYVWSLNGTVIPTATTNVITPTATGTYSVVVNLNGCTNINPLTTVFTVNTIPNFTLSTTNTVKCVNEVAVITVVPSNFAVTDPNFTYSWTLDGAPLTNTTSSISVTAYGNYAVTVSNFGCSTSAQTDVTLDTTDIPINSEGECVGINFIITATPINGSFDTQNVNYEWSTDSDVIAGNNQPTLNVTEYITQNNISGASFPLNFTVKVTTTPDGCVDTQVFNVASPFCTIQKGISPNGDGNNDNFDLKGLGVKMLSIFNRYGTKVYGFANYTDQWKGQTDNGKELPDGTYYFVIDQNSGETKTGWIYINR